MRILVTYPMTAGAKALLGGQCSYRPELADPTGQDGQSLQSAVAAYRPDTILTEQDLAPEDLEAWRRLMPDNRRFVVVKDGDSAGPARPTLPGPGVSIHRVLARGPNADLDVLCEAERLYHRHITCTTSPAALPPRRSRPPGPGQSVVVVGAGIVGVMTALRLVKAGFRVRILDACPDPRSSADWRRFGCTRGGGNARMFTLTEADNYNDQDGSGVAAQLFRDPVSRCGWRICSDDSLGPDERGWIDVHQRLAPWLARSFNHDIFSFNAESRSLWTDLRADTPQLFDGVELREGILRLYTDPAHLERSVARHQNIGALRERLEPRAIGMRYPALADACDSGLVAGGIEVVGFTVNVHDLVAKLLDALEAAGAVMSWETSVRGICRSGAGRVVGLSTDSGVIEADHYMLSTGVYGHELLAGTASAGLIQGVLGVWMTLPNLEPKLENSLKLARKGHMAEDANVTVARDAHGDDVLVYGSGYGYTGLRPGNILPDELDRLYAAVEENVRAFFPGATRRRSKAASSLRAAASASAPGRPPDSASSRFYQRPRGCWWSLVATTPAALRRHRVSPRPCWPPSVARAIRCTSCITRAGPPDPSPREVRGPRQGHLSLSRPGCARGTPTVPPDRSASGTVPSSVVYVAVYSLAYSEGLVRELPYVPHFVERALCHLGALARPAAKVVLVTPSPIAEDILVYHFRDLLGLDADEERSARSRLVQLWPRSPDARPLAELIVDDRELLGRIRDEIDTADEAVLVNVSASPEMERLEAALGIQAEEGPLTLARRWGSKSGSKRLFAQAQVPSFRGRPDALFSVEDVTDEVNRLDRATPPATHVVLKLDDVGWSAGLGNVVIDCAELVRTGSLAEAVESIMQPWARFESEIRKGGAIVEEFVAGASSSPSGQGTVDTAGAVSVRATHEQIVEHGHYLGCTYPCREQFREQIAAVVGRIGQALAGMGVHGTFGVDFVGYEDGRLLAAEVNVRKLAPTHVMTYVEAAVGDRLGPSGDLERSGKPIAYVHRRLFRPDALAGLTVARAVAALARRRLLWDPNQGAGVMLHILGALPACGYVETTSVAPSSREARDLDVLVEMALLQEAQGATPGVS